MKYFKWFIIVCMTVALIGCQSSEPSGEGYIFGVKEDRILILDQVKKSDFDKEWNDIFDDYTGQAIWLKTSTTSHLKVGQKVRYWIDGGVNASFPEQASARKIKIIDEEEN